MITLNLSSPEKALAELIKEYVATSYVGSRVLSLFSRPTPPDADARAAS